MNKPTKILADEHQNILTVIGALLKECDKVEKGGEVNQAFFEKAFDFIKNYADRFHHAKEEDILFTALDNCENMHCSPMNQMRHEHDLGRGFVKGAEAALKSGNKKDLIKNARNYGDLLQDHIFKEDNILYPMADEALSETAQKEIAEKFGKIAELGFNEKEWR